MSSRQERLREIDVEINKLQEQVNKLVEERYHLRLAQNKEEYPCKCVALNGDIGVFDMGEQEQLGRVPLGLGFVAQTLSASKSCPVCKGTGKPHDHVKHNHFGEMYLPASCPACKILKINVE